MLTGFNCAKAIGNLWSNRLGVNNFSSFPYFGLCLPSDAIEE